MNAVTEIKPVSENVKEIMQQAAGIELSLSPDEAKVIGVFEEKANAAYGDSESADLKNELLIGLRNSLRADPTVVARGVERSIERDRIFGAFMAAAIYMVGRDLVCPEDQRTAKACRDMIHKNTVAFIAKSSAASPMLG